MAAPQRLSLPGGIPGSDVRFGLNLHESQDVSRGSIALILRALVQPRRSALERQKPMQALQACHALQFSTDAQAATSWEYDDGHARLLERVKSSIDQNQMSASTPQPVPANSRSRRRASAA